MASRDGHVGRTFKVSKGICMVTDRAEILYKKNNISSRIMSGKKLFS